MKFIISLAVASGLLILGLVIADFEATGHFEAVSVSLAISFPILAAAAFHLASRPAVKTKKKK